MQDQKKYFFGWENFKKVIIEFTKIYSGGQKSFFSKKRIESGIAFIVAQWGMIFFLLENHQKLTSTDMAIWAGVEFAVAGYIINHIQKEKKGPQNEPDELN